MARVTNRLSIRFSRDEQTKTAHQRPGPLHVEIAVSAEKKYGVALFCIRRKCRIAIRSETGGGHGAQEQSGDTDSSRLQDHD